MGLSKHNPSTPQVTLLVSSTSGRIPWSLLSWLTLGSGAVFLLMVILSGARLIVDPYSPNWLKTAFPQLVNSFETAPQTTDEIRAEMRSQGITADQPIPWPQLDQPKVWFYPILAPDSKAIRELWVYRVRGSQQQRIDQVTIRPIKESFITTPLVGTASQVASVDSDATLTDINIIPSQSPEGPWLLLEGKRRYGNTVMRYGQILSYQPNTHRLHRLLNWSSPADQPPQWQASDTGDQQLLIDQTIGLRPNFLLYQLVPNDPPRLREISLYRSVYASDLGTSLYDKALKLAQGGVWSHSLQMMQSAKQGLATNWSPAAQAQLDLIQLHAERTNAQTEQTWSSQQQHILAYLIDGQWEKALIALEDNPTIYDSTLKRLERDFDALWRSVTTHLQVHPQDESSQIWGALLVTARQSSDLGEEWLQKKTRSQKTLERLQTVDGRAAKDSNSLPDEEKTNLVGHAAEPFTADTPGRYRSLIGEARVIGTPDGGWVRSQTLPTLASGHTWYHIEIQLLQDDSGWHLPSISTRPTNFWTESLPLRRQMRLFKDKTAVARVTAHGVKLTETGIALLAAGPQIDGPLLVTTDNSLRWLATFPWQSAPPIPPPESPDTLTTSDSPPGPAPVNLIAATLGHQLGLTSEQTAQLYPHLQYARVDLVEDLSKEHLVSIGPDSPPELALTPGKTLIFSHTGELLYSDIGQAQSLLALTDKKQDQPVTLLVEQAGRYTLLAL